MLDKIKFSKECLDGSLDPSHILGFTKAVLGMNDKDKKALFDELNKLENKTPQIIHLLAIFNYIGIGTEKNLDQAFKLYTQAHNAGFVFATNNLAGCYQYGKGTEKNLHQAFMLYTQAHNAGFVFATNNLACCYQYGKGTEKKLLEASRLYKIAADCGFEDAIGNLNKLEDSNEYKAVKQAEERNKKLLKVCCGLALCLVAVGAVYCYRNPKALAEAGTFLSNKTSSLTDNSACNAICKFAKSIIEMFAKLIPASLKSVG